MLQDPHKTLTPTAHTHTSAYREQELQNLMQSKQYLQAIRLALRLNQPHRMRTLSAEILNESEEGKVCARLYLRAFFVCVRAFAWVCSGSTARLIGAIVRMHLAWCL